jgi:hypothetical protein
MIQIVDLKAKTINEGHNILLCYGKSYYMEIIACKAHIIRRKFPA